MEEDSMLPVHQTEAPQPKRSRIGRLEEVPIDLIYADAQIREHIDEEDLKGLVASIANIGLLEPIAVRLRPDGRYEIIYGERRYRAMLAAGEKTVPCLILDLDYKEAVLAQFTENMLRAELNPIEVAQGAKLVKDLHGWSINEMSEQTGIPRRTLGDRLKLLKLVPALKERVATGKMPLMHAIPAAGLGPEQQIATLRYLEAVPRSSREYFEQLCKLLLATEGIPSPDLEKAINNALRMMIRRAGKELPDDLKGATQTKGKALLILPKRYPANKKLPNMPKAGSFLQSLSEYITTLSQSDDPEFKAAALVLGTVYNSISPDDKKEPQARKRS